MEEINYLDFDIQIESSDDGYRVRILNSPAGQADSSFTLPFSELEIENFLLRIGRPRQGTRRLESQEMQAARTFGSKLFDAVFSDEVRGRLRSSQNEARQKRNGLRFRLRLSGVPELAELPWEYLYDSNLDEFLVLSVQSPLVRYIDLPRQTEPLTSNLPLRILVMISSPTDFPQLDVEKEYQNLRNGLVDLESRGLVILDRLEKASLASLQTQLRREKYHIFHYIGHGGFDDQSQDGVLMLEDENKRGRPVSGRFLGTLLHDARSMRLALLNACEGARTSRTDPFAGVAHSLIQHGVPAVIAMQNEITDEAAIVLAHEFYGALADSYPVDAALSEARKAIFAQNNDIEWGTPVLYLRSPDGKIFDLARAQQADRGLTAAHPTPSVHLPPTTAAHTTPPADTAATRAAGVVPAPLPVTPDPASAQMAAPPIQQQVAAVPVPAPYPTRRSPLPWIVGIVGLLALAVVLLNLFGVIDLQRLTGLGLAQVAATPTHTLPPPTSPPAPTELVPASIPPTEAVLVPVTEEPATSTPTESPTEAPTAVPTEAPTATSTAPSSLIPAPGEGDVIAFASDRSGIPQIWLLVIDDEEQIQLTEMPDGACQPDWSPDGLQLVFISPCQGNELEYPNAALYVINADGTGLRKLTHGILGDFDPVWSSTGLIAFTSLRENLPQIFVIDSAGDSEPVQLTRSSYNRHPAWSPDGTLIAIVTTRLGPMHVYTMPSAGEISPDGKQARQFTRPEEFRYYHPRWSPDGNLLIYTQEPAPAGLPDIAGSRVEDIGKREFQISTETGRGPMKEADFSSDGRWIVYEGWPDGKNHDIWRMTVNGSGRVRLTTDPGLDFDAAWRP